MKKLLEQSEFYNAWLEKYHGITVEQLIEQEPDLVKTTEWYKKYAVTQEQHDEWYAWAIDRIAKHYKWSKKLARRQFAFEYINLSPSVRNG